MKKKRGSGKKARVDAPVEELTKQETMEHYNAVMLEELNSKIDLVIEGLEATKRELKGDIKALRNDMDNQFCLVHAAIRCNADGIRELKVRLDCVIEHVDNHEERLNRANL